MARHRLRLRRRTFVWDTGWIWWRLAPAELWWGLCWDTYQTCSGGVGLVLRVAFVPAVQMRLSVVIYDTDGGREP